LQSASSQKNRKTESSEQKEFPQRINEDQRIKISVGLNLSVGEEQKFRKSFLLWPANSPNSSTRTAH
jgi:hypothetical protein